MTMGMLDGILGSLGGNAVVENLAAKVGLSPEQVQSAVAALGTAHSQEGDTVATAAASTGLSADTLQQVLGHLGGEGALASVAGMLDRDGDGSPVNDITDMIGGFFNKK
jgi:ATP phosphoribosyltransferase regulatory subunit HisZ